MKNLFFLFLFLFSFLDSFAQQIENIFIVNDKETKSVSAWKREGILYVSTAELAEALSISYFENDKTGKVELKSNYFLLKTTPRNPFIVVTPRSSGAPKVFQLPTSTYIRNNKTFIPLPFSLTALEIIVEREIKFEKPNRIIVGKKITSPTEGKQWMYDIPDLPPTTGYDITGISITEKVNGTLIRVHSKSVIPSYYSSFDNDELTIIFRKVNADIQKTSRRWIQQSYTEN